MVKSNKGNLKRICETLLNDKSNPMEEDLYKMLYGVVKSYVGNLVEEAREF